MAVRTATVVLAGAKILFIVSLLFHTKSLHLSINITITLNMPATFLCYALGMTGTFIQRKEHRP